MCDGYQFTAKSSNVQTWAPEQHDHTTAMFSLERALTTLIANEEEKRAIHFFRAEAAPVLSGSLDTSFWGRLVLQVSHSEPAVRLALMAVGSLFEHTQLKAPALGTTKANIQVSGRRYAFGIQCYNKAISALMTRIEQPDTAEEVALLTCLLFVCVEFLKGNEAEALALCEKGSKVFHSLTVPSGGDGRRYDANAEPRDGTIEAAVAPIFARLGVLTALFGQPLQAATEGRGLSDRSPPQLPLSVPTLGAARTALFELMEKGQTLIRASMYHKWTTDPEIAKPKSLFAHQSRLLSDLENWYQGFEKLDRSASPKISFQDQYASSILRIYYLNTYIWLCTCLYKLETSFDNHLTDFMSIVDIVEELLASPTSERYLPIFSFEMGIVPPLYFTAINCRQPVLRRRAVALLRKSPRRESLWDAIPMAEIAERVIMFEERNLDRATDAWPKDNDRVYDTEIGQKFVDGETKGYPVIFKTRPKVVDSEWNFIEEFINIPSTIEQSYPKILGRDPGVYEQCDLGSKLEARAAMAPKMHFQIPVPDVPSRHQPLSQS